jgi:hypothetical protein
MAAEITWDDVAAFAPELTDADEIVRSGILAYVNATFNPDDWGGTAAPALRLARIYLAAHLGTLTKRGQSGKAGPISSESVGGISRSYATFSYPSILTTTPYGQALLELINRSAARAPVVI